MIESVAQTTLTTLATQVQEAIGALDQAAQAPVDQLKQETHVALEAAIRLRDALIQRLRAATAPEGRVGPRSALDQVNVAISLVTGVEYPIEKMDRQSIKQARGVLEGLVASGWV